MNSVYYTTSQYDMDALHRKVMESISVTYYNYTKSEKIAYKIGRLFKSVKNFAGTPQASALGLIAFWAAFVITAMMLAMSINTFMAYLIFGIIFLIHTHLTFDAVSALVQQALAINLLGNFNV